MLRIAFWFSFAAAKNDAAMEIIIYYQMAFDFFNNDFL